MTRWGPLAEIPSLSEDQWDELAVRLTDYARKKLALRFWMGVKGGAAGSALKGLEAHDIAAEAIVGVLDGNRESWNRESYPTFFDFLKSIVDSKVSELVKKPENKTTRRYKDEQLGRDEQVAGVVSHPTSTLDLMVDLESRARFRAALIKEIEADNLALGLFECLESDMKDRSDIATILDVEVSEVYNAQKRLGRKVQKLAKKFAAEE